VSDNYLVYQTTVGEGINKENRIVKAWHKGVICESLAIEQLLNLAKLPFIYKWVASMPDAHWGNGSAIGTVLPTQGAIIPSAVGVDLGCGMCAVSLGIMRNEIPNDLLPKIREAIEKAVPNGRSNNGGPHDIGAWGEVPQHIMDIWHLEFMDDYAGITAKHPGAQAKNTYNQLGTLGTGNHFIELSEDKSGGVWIVLHSGSRGLGNKIGSYFTNLAKELCAKWFISLPDPELAYLPSDTPEFRDYWNAVQFAQRFALKNREIMLWATTKAVMDVLGRTLETGMPINCHHNYVAWEHHFGKNVMVTRKGAVRAQNGDWGIIPGSMGARTYIVRGLGNADSFCSCSHGAGRAMGRKQAIKKFTLDQHIAATEGVECRKDASVLDETPMAYKPIDDVMAAQADLVTPVVVVKQFLCVKGAS
jgi:tRNA-splicing ligase RtcB (3'-phosphate/5'-hydroxy nucleic acid ligase)